MFDSETGNVKMPGARSAAGDTLVEVRGLNLWYGAKHALKDVSFEVKHREVLAFIGPSGCGKSTALKCLNRMHDNARGVRITGEVWLDGREIHAPDIDPPVLRRRFGWVAQKPNPFPASIWENVAYGPRIHGLCGCRADLAIHVERCLRKAMLWDEVKDDMHRKEGYELSGGQQQRLCIARALSTDPDILLMDEPTGSIDPVATGHIEELMVELKADHAIVVITHSMMQARRVSDRVAYYHLGELVEIGPVAQIFDAPVDDRVRDFIEGRMG